MALDRLTKVDGGGISTTSDYRVGIITATKFVGPIEGDVTGSITATDGTFSGNVTIGGTLTYEDVTNIDSVGIITARDGVHVGAGVSVVGIVTASTFKGDGDFVDIDVDGHTNLDNLSIAGVTTTTGSVNVGDDLDVTDDLTIGGEFNMVGSSDSNKYFDVRTGASNKLIIRSSLGGASNLETMLSIGRGASSFVGNLTLGDSSDDSSAAGPEFTLNRNSASPANADYLGQIKFAGRSSAGNQRNYAKITGKILDVTNGAEDGILEFAHIRNGSQTITGRWRSDSLQLLNDTNLSVAGDTTLTGDLDVDGHTNLDNVNIAGVTTALGLVNININASQSVSNPLLLQNSAAAGTASNPDVVKLAFGSQGSVKASIRADVYGNGAMTFHTNNDTEKLRITAAGVLKIERGSATDTALEINTTATTGACRIKFNESGTTKSQIAYSHANDQLEIIGATGNSLAFFSGGSQVWNIDTNGHLLPNSAGAVNIGSATAEIGDVYIADNKQVQLGDGQDLKIYHSSSDNHSYIKESGSGDLLIQATQIKLQDASGTDYLRGFTGGAVYLHNAGNNKFETTSTGVHVTGEVSASQDYPDIGPTVDLNFAATESLDPRINFYRASAASYIDQNGKLVLVSPNTPRFVYDQTTKKCKGLLIETSGRNRVSSAGSNNGSATATGTVLGNAFTTNENYHGIELPTGEIGVVRKLVSNDSGMRFGDYSGSANTSYTGSIWMRSVSGTISSGVFLDINDGTTIQPTITEEWVRYSVTSATNNSHRFFDIYCAGTKSIYYYGVQLEDSAYMTSYIPVYPNMSFGLRAPDIAVIDGQNFTDFYNTDESSVLAVGIPNRPASAQGQLNIVHIGDSNNDGHGIFRENGTKDPWYHIRNNNSTPTGGNLNPSGFGDWDAGEEARIAIAFKSGDQAISVNGGNQITATVTSNYPTANISKMWIGSHGSGSYFEGTISRIAYYPKQLTDSQLNTLTAS